MHIMLYRYYIITVIIIITTTAIIIMKDGGREGVKYNTSIFLSLKYM